MTHQAPPSPAAPGSDPGQRIAQLREALRLVDRLADRASERPDEALDDAARLSAAYDRAPPIARRRFDALAAETSIWAAAGVEALLAANDETEPPRLAAGRLAEAIEEALGDLSELLD
jgi:hypothetical protein